MNNYRVSVFPIDGEDGSVQWGASFLDIKGCGGGGATPAEAIEEAFTVLDSHLDAMKALGQEIPADYQEPLYSGKISLRMSKIRGYSKEIVVLM